MDYAWLVVTIRFVHSLQQGTTFVCGVYGEGHTSSTLVSTANANISYSANEINWEFNDKEGSDYASPGPASTLSARNKWQAVRIYSIVLLKCTHLLPLTNCNMILLLCPLRQQRMGGALAPSR